MDQILPQRPRLRPGQLGIVIRVVRVPVMRQVEIAEMPRPQQHQKPQQLGGAVIEPAGAKRRAVDHFVQRREKEDQCDSLRQHHRPPEGQRRRDPGASGRDRAEMQRQPQRRRPVRLGAQLAPLLGRKRRQQRPVNDLGHGTVHAADYSRRGAVSHLEGSTAPTDAAFPTLHSCPDFVRRRWAKARDSSRNGSRSPVKIRLKGNRSRHVSASFSHGARGVSDEYL